MPASFVHKKPIDMEKLTILHSKQVALGNMGVNARGDVLGQGGKILKTREDIMNEYYEANPELNPKAVINIKYTKEDEATLKNINAVMNTSFENREPKNIEVTKPTFNITEDEQENNTLKKKGK